MTYDMPIGRLGREPLRLGVRVGDAGTENISFAGVAGGTLENAQAMAAHESPRTTKLYDRTDDAVTLDEVERITI